MPPVLPGVLSLLDATVFGVAVLVMNMGSAVLLGAVWMPKPAKALNTSLRSAGSAVKHTACKPQRGVLSTLQVR